MSARLRVRDASGTLRTIVQLRMRDAGNTLRTITRVRMRDAGNVLRVVYDTTGASSFAVTSAPNFVVGSSYLTGTATTDSTTATATGGTGPYTYAWTLLSYTHPTTAPTITGAALATTAFIQTNIGVGQDFQAHFRVTATDSATPANTATYDVTASWSDTA